MNILDENIPKNQRQLLEKWRIHVRQIGINIGRMGMQDEEIVPFLLQMKRPTFLHVMNTFMIPACVMQNIARPIWQLINTRAQSLFVEYFGILILTQKKNEWVQLLE